MRVAIGLLFCLTIVLYVAPVGGRKVRKRCKPLEFADVTSDCNKDPNADGWYPDGTVCTFTCRTGCVKDVGGTKRVCKVKGRSKWWTGGRGLRCKCNPCEDAPPTIPNTTGPDCTSPYDAGDTCTYQCAPGYTKESGNNDKTCVNGKWKGEDLMCVEDADECSSTPCQNGGTCTAGDSGYTCTCVDGYTGDNCETDIDDCEHGPCENGGTCVDGVNSYTCDCAAGYEGGDCEIDIDDCDPYPCENGGTCMDGANSYTCDCVAGYEGDNCETDIDECEPAPCENGGTCDDGVNSYTCDCADGYEGDDCEIDIDDCTPNPCNNSGNCTDGVNSYTCECADGYAGDNCEIVVVDGNWATWLSWGSCGVSCGGGVQTRTRTCDNPPPTIGGADCVGHPSQTRACNEWECPDCMRICAVGSLNAACDACTCDGHVLTGHVTDTRRVPLGDAEIRYAENPSDVVAYTDPMGDFTVTGACSQGVDIIVRRTGYFEAHATSMQQDATTSYVRVNMTALVPPIITEHPQSKKRLVGQDVTFCCAAHGNPPISSYEWFKDGLVLDEDVYGYNDTLTIENLAVDDSGVYRCRANSDAGSKYSDEATLEVEEDSLSSCPVLPEENLISLPDDCVQEDTNSTGYDIGSCGGDDCVGDLGGADKMCVDTKRFCCVPTSTETRTVYCSGYSLNVTVTTACGCGSCVKTFTKRIQGRAYGVNRTNNASTEVPLTYGAVIMDGQVVDYTSETGMFEFTTETTASKISLTFRDYFKVLVTSTRVLSLTGSDTLNFDVILKLRPPPITIMATETSVIDLGTVEGAEPLAEIDIPANSFFTSDGNLFEGEVKASVSFVDPRNEEDFESIQGELTAVDVEGQENTMQTFGMFAMDFETEEGATLELGTNVSVHIDPSESGIDTTDVDENGNLRTKIWFLDSDSGLWQDAGNLRVGIASRRRKRSTFIIGEFLYISDRWYNYDRIEPYDRRCWVKIRAYNSVANFVYSMATGVPTGLVNNADVAVITTSNTGGFSRNNALSVYQRGFTSSYYGGGICLEALCEPTGNDFSARVHVVKDSMHFVAVDKSLYTGFSADFYNSIEIKDEGKTLSFDVFRPAHSNGPIYTYFDWWGCYYPTGASSHFAFVNNAYQPYVFPPYTFDQNQYSQPITVTSWYPNENELKKVCFIKVFVKFDTDHAQTEIRVTSRGGGVYAPNTGVIYGIREDRTKTNPNDPKSAFVCVEFKCPGPILESQPDGTTSPPYPGANDNTRITVVARNNICKHDSRLTSTMTAGIDTDLLLEVSDVVRNENTVEFTIPNGNDFGRDYGTYVKTGSGYTGYSQALEYCRSGSDTGGFGKPFVYNKYHAIRFNCGDNFEFTTERPGVVTEAEEEIATAGMATQDRESSTYTTLRTEQTTKSTTNANTQGTTAQEGTTAPSWTRYSDNDDYRTGDFGATRGTEASTKGTNTPWRDYYDYNYDEYNYDYNPDYV